jgi:hypothetical protein
VIWDWAGGRIELAAGRVLQVTLQGQDAFWTAAEPSGWNVGGDRLWLGPERDWFWAGDDPDDLSLHQVPPEIDPGEWRADEQEMGRATYVANPVLRNRQTGDSTRVHITRQILLRYADSARVEYEIHTTLQVVAAPPGQEVSAWSVLQVPTGGVLTVRLSGDCLHYRDYLKPADRERLTVGDGVAEIRLDGKAMSKIGIRPDVVSGRLSYEREGLIIERQMDVHPANRYCDHPLGADRAEQGDAVQVFEDDGHYGGYAEIEHHSPAIRINGPKTVVDVCRTAVSTVTVR